LAGAEISNRTGRKLSPTAFIIAGFFGIAPLLALPSYACLLAIIPVILIALYLVHFY